MNEGTRRRRFTAEYKVTLLEAIEAAGSHGEASALLRREGLYWSHVAAWRKQVEAGRLEDSWTAPEVRRHIAVLTEERRALLAEIRQLEEANAELRRTIAANDPAGDAREILAGLPGDEGEASGDVEARKP